jgi:hypothetical protein
MPAESGEAETLPRNALLKNQRASVAMASIASWEVARTFVEAQISRFSLINSSDDVYSLYTAILYFLLFCCS